MNFEQYAHAGITMFHSWSNGDVHELEQLKRRACYLSESVPFASRRNTRKLQDTEHSTSGPSHVPHVTPTNKDKELREATQSNGCTVTGMLDDRVPAFSGSIPVAESRIQSAT